VYFAISFNGQPALDGIKIDDVRSDFMLTPESDAQDLILAEQGPKAIFRLGSIVPETSGNDFVRIAEATTPS
jgi:hypothetical protein